MFRCKTKHGALCVLCGLAVAFFGLTSVPPTYCDWKCLIVVIGKPFVSGFDYKLRFAICHD